MDMNKIEIMLKEYETLRQEILTSMSNRNSILSFGLSIIGAIFTASIAVEMISGLSQVSGLILVVVIPLICIFVTIVWLGEYDRMQRAGKFLGKLEEGLENKINNKAGERLLTWETDLRRRSAHMYYPYFFTILLLMAIGFASQYIGYSQATISIHSGVVAIITFAEIVTIIYAFIMLRKLST